MLSAIVLGTVLKVIDGDTIKIDVKDCNYSILCKNIEVRFEGIDTPEIRGKCDKEKALALQAKKLVEENYKAGDEVNLGMARRDKYFRLLSKQQIVSDRLITLGLAVPYHGEKRTKDWCQ